MPCHVLILFLVLLLFLLLLLLVPPLKAEIVQNDNRRFLVAGETAEVRCLTYGSRPPAQVTWWKDGDSQLSPQSSHVVIQFAHTYFLLLRRLRHLAS